MISVDVRRRRGDFQVDAQFISEPGGVTALFGRSGAGKTMLVNMIAGLDRPDQGRIVIDDQVLFDSETGIDVPTEKRRLGYVFQEDRLFPHMSVRRNLVYGMPREGGAVTFDQVADLLDLAGLLDRRPRTLSGGEKQRVSIGRALLANPRLLLMDEPLAALDRARKDEILPFIERLRDRLDMPIVYVTHEMNEIVRLAETLVLISDGRVEAVGPLEELMSRLDLRPMTGRYEAGAVINAEIAEHVTTDGLSRVSFAGGTMLVPLVDLPVGERLRIRIRARDVSLALTPPTEISILNIFPGTITEIGDEVGPQVDILVDVGTPLWARVTRYTVRNLDLRPGSPVFVLIKAIAIDRHSLGRGGAQRRFRATDDT